MGLTRLVDGPAGALDRLLVLLGLEQLLGTVQRGVRGGSVHVDAHREVALGLLDGSGGLGDLGLGLAGQPDVFPGEAFGLLQVVGGVADRGQQPGPLAARRRQVEPNLVEHLGGGPEPLVGGDPVLLTAGQKSCDPIELLPRPVVLVTQLVVAADIGLRLRLGDRQLLEGLREGAAHGRPVGPGFSESGQHLLPAAEGGVQAAPGHLADDRLVLAEVVLDATIECLQLPATLLAFARAADKRFNCSPRPDISRRAICCC